MIKMELKEALQGYLSGMRTAESRGVFLAYKRSFDLVCADHSLDCEAVVNHYRLQYDQLNSPYKNGYRPEDYSD